MDFSVIVAKSREFLPINSFINFAITISNRIISFSINSFINFKSRTSCMDQRMFSMVLTLANNTSAKTPLMHLILEKALFVSNAVKDETYIFLDLIF